MTQATLATPQPCGRLGIPEISVGCYEAMPPCSLLCSAASFSCNYAGKDQECTDNPASNDQNRSALHTQCCGVFATLLHSFW